MLARNLRLTVQIKELLEKNTGSREIASLLRNSSFSNSSNAKGCKRIFKGKKSLFFMKNSPV